MPTTRIDLGTPTLLEFSGPDAIRFLNGQLTQDVRLIAGSGQSLPACITDAKGKIQFRVWLHARGEALLVEGPEGCAEEIEARLTRYLIADDVEVRNLSGQWQLHHLTEAIEPPPDGVIARQCQRFGTAGQDWWISAGEKTSALQQSELLEGQALENFRIRLGIPVWGSEILEGMLPHEAGLDTTDISYFKGCYIGQEVISRVKSAGKVNRMLTHLVLDAEMPTDGISLVDADGKPAGDVTSIASDTDATQRHALGFIKRGASGVMIQAADGSRHPLTIQSR